MALVRQPSPCTLRDLYIADGHDPANVTAYDAGSTSEPKHYVAPACQIIESKTASAKAATTRQAFYNKVPDLPRQPPPGGAQLNEFDAALTITRHASEGSNTSIYVQQGIYETNFTFDDKTRNKQLQDEDYAEMSKNAANYLYEWTNARNPRVYFVMTANIAQLNRQAEIEHCNDFILAYQLTLQALETALTQAAAAVLPHSTSAQAARAARVEKLKSLLPADLKDVLQDFPRCADKYIELCRKSKDRDDDGWHTFGFTYLGSVAPAGTIHYLTGGPRQENGRVFLEYAVGATQIGTHSSASIIHF